MDQGIAAEPSVAEAVAVQEPECILAYLPKVLSNSIGNQDPALFPGTCPVRSNTVVAASPASIRSIL
jgi:hypothetical protein